MSDEELVAELMERMEGRACVFTDEDMRSALEIEGLPTDDDTVERAWDAVGDRLAEAMCEAGWRVIEDVMGRM